MIEQATQAVILEMLNDTEKQTYIKLKGAMQFAWILHGQY